MEVKRIKFEDALQALREGKKIVSPNGHFYDHDDCVAHGILKDGWEVVEEKIEITESDFGDAFDKCWNVPREQLRRELKKELGFK